MKLTQQQIEAVGAWVAGNASISDVQKRLSEHFGINMTYMDVRFLIDDIGAQLRDKPEPKPAEPEEPAAQPDAGDGIDGAQNSAGSEQRQSPGGVQVSVSPIQRPGAAACGDVVFSDGEKAEWLIDQMGRLSLVPATQGYQPTREDIGDFQAKLQALFR